MEKPFRYRAFISYSHSDEAWAKWLHRALEQYRVPARLRRGDLAVPKRLIPIFRDRDELPSAAELGSVIEAALRESEALIVICSPRAAQSRWVDEEIRYFRSLGRADRVFAFLVAGEPHAREAADECFPPAMRHRLDQQGRLQTLEPIAADARPQRDGRRDALLKIVAGLLGVGLDELRQRERQRRFWQGLAQAAIGLALAASMVTAWQWFEHYEAARQRELRIGTLYEQGRRALLEQDAATAAGKFAAVQALGFDSAALRFMAARAMESVRPVQGLPRSPLTGYAQRPAFSADGRQWLLPVVGADWTVGLLMQIGSVAPRLLEGLPRAPQLSRWLPDGQRLLVAGFDESTAYGQRGASTQIWDVKSGQRVVALAGNAGHFGTPLSHDGRWLLTAGAGSDSDVRLHDTATGAMLRRLPHPVPAHAAAFSPDGQWVFSGDADGVVRQWQAASGRLVRTLPGRTATAITGLLLTPDGRRAVAISRKGDVRVWSLPEGALQLAFAADKSFVADARLDAAGQRLLTVGRQGYKVWDLQRGTLLFARDVELDWEASGDLDASGEFVVIATSDSPHAELWDVASRRRISLLQFEAAAVTAAAFAPDGHALLLGGETGGAARIAPRPGPLLELAQPPSVYAARFSPDGRRIASVGHDGLLRLWDATTGAPLAVGEGHAQRVTELVYSPDGQRIATGADDGTLRLWRSDTAAPMAKADAHAAANRGIYRLLQSGDGHRLMTIPDWNQDADYTTRLWDARDLGALHTLVHPAAIRDAAFSPDGRTIATAGRDGVLRLWNVQDGQLATSFALSKRPLIAVVWLPDGRSLLTADDERQAMRIDATSGATIDSFTVATRDDAPSLLAVAGDGRQWAMATELGEIWVRDLAAGSDWRALAGGGQRLLRLRYLASGLLVSAGYDGTIRVWDPGARAEEIAVLGGHDNAPWSLDVDAAGERLLSAGLDGLVRSWRVSAPPMAAPAP